MLKKIGLFVLSFLLIFAIGFTATGFVVRHILDLEGLMIAGPKNLASRLEVVAKPMECGEVALQRDINAGYIYAQVMHDFRADGEEMNQKMSYQHSYLLLDREGNVVQEGDTLTVGNAPFGESRYMLGHLNDEEELFVGQMSVRKSFTLEQRKELESKVDLSTMDIRMDSYYLQKGWYYPEHVSVVAGEQVIFELDCTVPEGVTGEKIANDPRWILIDNAEEWQTNENFNEDKSELLNFAKKNWSEIFRTSKRYDYSNPLTGLKVYDVTTNTQYVMISQSEMNFVALTIAFGSIVAVVSLVVNLIIWGIVFLVKRRR